jgi:hypothetical protein
MKMIQTYALNIFTGFKSCLFCKRSYCILIFCLFIKYGLGQSLSPATQKKIDSLKIVLQTKTADTDELKIWFTISSAYYWSFLFPDSAIKYANLVIDKTDKIKCNPYWKGGALSILGLIYGGPNPPQGLKYHFASLKVRQQIQDKKGISATLHNIANIYSFRMGYYTEALKYNLESLKIREELNDSYLIGASYANIAYNYINEKKYDEALKYYQLMGKLQLKGLTRSEQTGRLGNMGICYCNLGDYEGGLKFLFEALKIEQNANDKLAINNLNVSIGSCYAKLASSLGQDDGKSKHAEALEYINKGLSSSSSQYMVLRREAYAGLIVVYEGLQDYKNALLYTTMHRKLIDSISNSEIRHRIEQLRIEYENELITQKETANQEKIVLEEKALREKLLAEQRTKQEIRILDEKNFHALALNEERLLNEKSIAEEKARFESAMAIEKAKHEREQLAKKQLNHLLILSLASAIVVSILTFFLFRQRNIKKRAIERADSFRKMAELELQSLRAQLNPHFMFNSLNAIQELILKEDNDNSHLYLSRFAELLRMLLDNANQPFVSLKKELDLLELYLSLEKLRIPDLNYSIEIDKDVDVSKLMIPNMMLQPYLENAIWHGLSHKNGEKNLFIRINKRGDGVICKVEDNGVGRKVSSELKGLYRKEHRSRGMELLTKRFNLLSAEYGSDIQTNIEDLHDNGTATGTKVSIVLPHSLTAQTQPVYS